MLKQDLTSEQRTNPAFSSEKLFLPPLLFSPFFPGPHLQLGPSPWMTALKGKASGLGFQAAWIPPRPCRKVGRGRSSRGDAGTRAGRAGGQRAPPGGTPAPPPSSLPLPPLQGEEGLPDLGALRKEHSQENTAQEHMSPPSGNLSCPFLPGQSPQCCGSALSSPLLVGKGGGRARGLLQDWAQPQLPLDPTLGSWHSRFFPLSCQSHQH